MSRLIYTHIFLFLTIFCSNYVYGNDFKSEEFFETYEEPQRSRDRKKIMGQEGEATVSTEYRYGKKGLIREEDVIKISQSFIECKPGDSDFGDQYIYDKPLRSNRWLYPPSRFFERESYWKKFFDTYHRERWVFPNVYCNSDRIFTAVSWMRSGDGSHKLGDMPNMFEKHTPPSYSPSVINEANSQGIYCEWDGWLYPGKSEKYREWVDTNRKELISLVNVYCHNNRATYFYHSFGGDDDHGKGLEKPFQAMPSSPNTNSEYPTIACNWKGWLYKETNTKTWNADRTGSESKTRWSYERYFFIEDSDRKKRSMHGRVMNPFCSKDKGHGIVTKIRAYCFRPSSHSWASEKRNYCDDLF